MTYPKVLIFGQPFNNYSGGGITLTNLFKGWPKEKIAVAYIGHGLLNATTETCDNYYQLGREEHKWRFPFSMLQRKFPSGPKSLVSRSEVPINAIQTSLRYRLVNNAFYPFLRWIGLYHQSTRIVLSPRFKSWLTDYSPEIIYLQVTSRDEILFSIELIDHLKKKSIIHIMDDWPTTISNKGIFKRYWTKKIDKEFRILLDKVDLCLSISDAMSVEYKNRYNKDFIAFHNPIETDVWLPYKKSNYKLNGGKITILYSGRIGFGITESLHEVATAINVLNDTGFNIKLHIQTPTKNPQIINQIKRFKSVVINPFVPLEYLPQIFSEADILLLANDFNTQGVDYLKFSMPTKASEYMISGTPVLVYSAAQTAVSDFFSRNNCGYCVTKQGPEEIAKALRFMLQHEEYRKEISNNAFILAQRRFNANIVRSEFQNLIAKITLYKSRL